MKNHFIKNRCLAGAWMVAVMVLSASAAHAQPSAAAGATKYANTCAGCHGAAPDFAIRPSVHKASANAAAIPHYLPGDADIAAFVPPSRPIISPPGAAALTANSATLILSRGTTVIVTSYTVSCTGGGATKTAAGAATPGSTNITVTGLTASTAYNCSATATNASGTGLASAPPVSITTNATASPLPTPIVKIRLMNSGQAGTQVQCPVQYSSSNPPHWFLRVFASLPNPKFATAFIRGDGLPPGATFRYLFKVNGYPPPGHSPGIWYPSAGVSFNPPTRGNYSFEVLAQAWLNEQAISRVGNSAFIYCEVQ